MDINLINSWLVEEEARGPYLILFYVPIKPETTVQKLLERNNWNYVLTVQLQNLYKSQPVKYAFHLPLDVPHLKYWIWTSCSLSSGLLIPTKDKTWHGETHFPLNFLTDTSEEDPPAALPPVNHLPQIQPTPTTLLTTHVQPKSEKEEWNFSTWWWHQHSGL